MFLTNENHVINSLQHIQQKSLVCNNFLYISNIKEMLILVGYIFRLTRP